MLSYRKPDESDSLLYFHWANDLNVRKQSFDSKLINLENHKQWFSAKIKDETCLMLIFQNEEKCDIGQIRIQKENKNEALIGISIDEEYRGKGYAVEMLQISIKYFFEEHKNFIIKALIKKENSNSKYTFEKAGFEYESEVIHENIESLLYTKKVG
jgi:RimJ/RimL family protein N-acetyltransferase